MEGRKQNIPPEDVSIYIKNSMSRLFGRSGIFAGVHVFTASADVPDEIGSGPRLVVLPPSNGYSSGSGDLACCAAEDVLRHRGEQPRQHQNRLIFLAAEADLVSRLKDHVKTAIAWKSIVEDVDNGRMNLDQFQLKQAKRNREGAEQTAIQMVKEAYRWLLCPTEELSKGKPSFAWETLSISPSAATPMQEITEKLKDEEWIVSKWAPVHLHQLLNKWYFKDGATEVSAQKVWEDCCNYLYLPRLLTEDVFVNAITQAVGTCDYFGFASGKEGERYLEFTFGGHALVYLDGSSLLLNHETASAYKQKLDEESRKKEEQAPLNPDSPPVETTQETGESARTQPPPPNAPASVKKQFYGTVSLDPVNAKIEFATIMDEVVQTFTSKPDVAVEISVEIRATGNKGFDETLQRTIKENCNVLKFKPAEFDE